MLNQIIVMGRLVSDPQLQTFERDGKMGAIAQYRIAVERDYKKAGEHPVEFFACKIFDTEARYMAQYYHKGDLIVVVGRLAAEAYKRNGEETERIFTYIHARKNYMARQTGDTARTRVMNPVQDGIYDGLPPLPPDDLFGELEEDILQPPIR